MKLRTTGGLVATCLATILGLSLCGCVGVAAANQRSLLSSAGFRIHTPQTSKQWELYAAAPSYRIERATVNGKVVYAYKDERKGVAYIGGEREYQRYHELAVRQRIASDSYMAAEMNPDAAWAWYGPEGWARPVYW